MRGVSGLVLVLAIIVPAQSLSQFDDVNPCDEGVYRVIDEPRRSPGFAIGENDTAICDDKLRRGWYRFKSVAGNDMPTTCPMPNHCGTEKPIWLRGGHPTLAEGIVMREICGNLNTSDPSDQPCCEYKEEIFVKNCRSFHVYYLYSTVECPMAYCAGSIPPCPDDKWSPTGFPPCKDPYPILKVPPVLTGPHITGNQTFSFLCEIVNGTFQTEDRIEVTWIFNQQSDPNIPSVVLAPGQRSTSLEGILMMGRQDTNVGCQVRTFYENRQDKKSPAMTSNTVFLGLQTPPVLTGPIVEDNKTFHFECNITLSHMDSQPEIEVTWTFDGQADEAIPSDILTGTKRTATLEGSWLKGHLNTKVGCSARLRFSGSFISTDFLKSNTYFAGIKVSPNKLELSEAEYEKNVTVTSTIPVICEHSFNCCLTFRLNMNETSAVSFVNSCQPKLCFSDWNDDQKKATLNIGVVPIRDMVVRADQRLFLSFDEITPSHNDPYLDIFKGYKPGQIQIQVHNVRGSSCVLTGDPHVKAFDGWIETFSDDTSLTCNQFIFLTPNENLTLRYDSGRYDLFVAGDFIAYVGKNRNFEVQVRTSPCARVACVCGVVIKENNDVIKISRCGQSSATVAIAYPLSEGTVVQRAASGKYVGVYLPSGTEIRVEFVWHSLYLNLPALDNGQGMGLCGLNDGVRGNEYTYPNGTTRATCTRKCKDEFIEAWRVSGADSLFEVVPEPGDYNGTDNTSKPNQTYCSCSEVSDGQAGVHCSPRGHLRTAGTMCGGCADITSALTPSYVIGQGWINPLTGKPYQPYKHAEIPPVDTNKTWPVGDLTEAKARQLCLEAMGKSPLLIACQNMEGLKEASLEDCLSDILYGETQDYLGAITSGLTTECQTAVTQNPDNYVKDANGSLVLKPEFKDNLCPVDCVTHGDCREAGKCICHEGWEGSGCLIQSGIGPQLQNIIGEPMCDTAVEKCDKILINVTNVALTDNLRCRFHLEDHSSKQITAVWVKATAISSTLISCPFPASDYSRTFYNVSATNDGTLLGNSLPGLVFDSTCMECDGNECRVKSTACHIANICYKNGDHDPQDSTQICDVSRSTSAWSHVKNQGNSSVQFTSERSLVRILALLVMFSVLMRSL